MAFRAWMMLGSAALIAVSPVGAETTNTARIIDEGMNRSQVMMTAHELIDGIGPRLTNSPNIKRAQQWAVAKFTGYGLSNVHREEFDFGRGWEIIGSSVRMISPRPMTLTAMPIAWTPPSNGTLRAPIIVAPISRVEHFAAYRGKLAGKIVLVSLPGEGSEPTEPQFKRLTGEDIAKLDQYEQPTFDPHADEAFLKNIGFNQKLDAFLASEGALARVRISPRDGKLLNGQGYDYAVGKTPKLPAIEIAAEDYRRLARFARSGEAPVLEINSNVRFVDDELQDYSVIADIPGSDPKAGYVMAGAHLDSWTAGDGASDNGAGSVVVMEAARILRQIGARPKRTIRFALWSGEEQGDFGSIEYVDRHVAHRPLTGDPQGMKFFRWINSYPISPRPGYGDLKAYFNMDNGSGKIRGIYAEGNAAATPLLKEWLAPFATMGAGAVVASPTRFTDHEVFQAVAVPAFQFIQDPLDYGTRVLHSNVDTLDHMKAADLRQAAVVMAGVLLAAANSDRELPRGPLPTQPLPTNPFKYDVPEPK